MKNEEKSAIIDSIKRDDLSSFSAIFADENSLKIAFGRFPLLSVCYLYNAKKIIKNYERKLLTIKTYSQQNEPFSLYSHFKNISGKALRLYLSPQSIVSPLEMLSLLHRDKKVQRLFGFTPKNEEIERNLVKIYEVFHSQNVSIKTNKISIGLKKISKEEKTFLRRCLLISLLFVSLLFSAMLANDFAFGGIIFNQTKVFSASQFRSALLDNSHASLQNDLTLSGRIIPADFRGIIDGNNHTLHVNFEGETLIKNNFGTIKNLNIVYQNFENETLLPSSISLLTNQNSGNISNVKISFKNDAEEEKVALKINKTDGSFFAGFALSNNGTIENCDILLNVSISGFEQGDCYASPIAATNSGKIKNCKTLETSSIEGTEVDLSGVVAINTSNGTITNCTNFARLHQTSAADKWFPIVAGIAAENHGEITNCKNLGPLSITSTFASESFQRFAILDFSVVCGGLVGKNFGTISHGKNAANLSVTTDALSIYCGGIVAYSEADGSFTSLQNCGAECQISTTATGELSKAYVGGIAGFFIGKLENCFSLVQFSTPYDSSKNFVALAFGSSGYFNLFSLILVTGTNNFVLQNPGETNPQVGVVFSLNIIFYPNSVEITTSTESEIKTSEVYFE